MPLASSWRASLPGTHFVAPDAPMHHRYGHQWFSTEGNPLDPERIESAREAFDGLMNDVVRREGFTEAHDRVAFVGVSQGAIVAIDAVASGRWKVGALVAFSGLLPPQPVSPASNSTPVLLVHGENDTTIPPMATFKFTGGVSKFKDKLVEGMVKNNYTREFAEKTFTQLEGFGSYGFPESHAASFALIAYASSWMKCHHPDVFCTSLLNSQPMGFYSVAQIVQDARNHGVEVRPVCVNRSRWDCTMERIGNSDRFAVRLGMRVVRGLSTNDAARIILARAEHPFVSADDMWRRSGVSPSSLVKLAEADAFLPSLHLERRQALWDIKALRDEPLELWAAAAEREARVIAEMQEPGVALKSMTEGREVVEDYSHTGLTLRAHPVSFLRKDLDRKGIVTCAEAMGQRDGRWLWTAGLVLVRQRPGSAKGVMFLTLEDETGIVNAVVWPSLFERQRRVLMTASMMAINGRIQREGEVVHLVAQRLFDFSTDLASVGNRDGGLGDFPLPHGRGDQVKHGGGPDPRENPKPVVQAREIYIADLHIDNLKIKSRNFH